MKKWTSKKIFAVIGILMIIGLISRSVADESYRCYAFCNPDSIVNVRAKPSSSSDIAAILDCGDWTVTDGKTAKDNRGRTWLHIVEHFEYDESWVCMDYVSFYPVKIRTHQADIVSQGRVATRKLPDGDRTGWVKPGKTVTVYCEDGIWSLTNRGYIKTEYLREAEF